MREFNLNNKTNSKQPVLFSPMIWFVMWLLNKELIMKLTNILEDYRTGFYGEPDEAVADIKKIIQKGIDESSTGIGSCDATDFYGDMCKFLDSL